MYVTRQLSVRYWSEEIVCDTAVVILSSLLYSFRGTDNRAGVDYNQVSYFYGGHGDLHCDPYLFFDDEGTLFHVGSIEKGRRRQPGLIVFRQLE